MTAADPLQAFQSMVESINTYPVEAFLFVRDGLHAAASALHGEESSEHNLVQQFLHEQGMDWTQLRSQFEAHALPENLMQLITLAGGCDKFNRHVSGTELCWALRDLAVNRWGLLAPTVLTNWRIRNTQDFGRIVFAFIDHGLMQRQPTDSLADFDSIFTFEQAFAQQIENE